MTAAKRLAELEDKVAQMAYDAKYGEYNAWSATMKTLRKNLIYYIPFNEGKAGHGSNPKLHVLLVPAHLHTLFSTTRITRLKKKHSYRLRQHREGLRIPRWLDALSDVPTWR